MILTNAIAKNHVGEYIDCYHRMFGFYPMKIIKFPDGSLGLKDATETCMHIEDRGFNACRYDYMFKMTYMETKQMKTTETPCKTCMHCKKPIDADCHESLIIVRERGGAHHTMLIRLCSDCKALLLGIIQIFTEGEGYKNANP